MLFPYARIIPMHLTPFIAWSATAGSFRLIVFIVAKILADVIMHLIELSGMKTAAQVIQALADAINANAALQAAGVTATAAGNRLITNGDITTIAIADAGLTTVLDLRVEKTRLWWGSVAGTTSYDVMRGSLNELRSSEGNFASPLVSQLCLANDSAETFRVHTETPAAGQAVWYLVRGQATGTYDDGSASQSGSRDAEIGASGNGCP